MEYLHSKGIVHRDLKADNILIDKNMIAKITDFGSSRSMQETKMTKYIGTSVYMAPVCYINCSLKYNRKCARVKNMTK